MSYSATIRKMPSDKTMKEREIKEEKSKGLKMKEVSLNKRKLVGLSR